MTRPDRLIGLLLAGGKSTRMGGQDKGLLPWQGQPMAQRVYRTLKNLTPRVYISANRSLEDYEQLAPGHILRDPENLTDQGPLAGLLTGLRKASEQGAEAVLVCPCDTPDINPATLSALITAWQTCPDRPAIAESNGRIHPLHGVYPVGLMGCLECYLKSGERRVVTFAERVGAIALNCPETEAVFRNRNKPEDLKG
ncbi:MAG TPA: molybdenum cofactor guanylyltransferase [Marinobacter sp.]|jgi:molybdopterin-guanine dinucleotide biosynthesis protein A|nr:molybdenum cofactor guanylyltransferase [Marinobacter sp.]